MAKTFNCKNCNEKTVFECVSFDKSDNYGDFRRCNLCGDIRPMQRRMTEKKMAREALIDWLLSE
jgi:transcription elongation factor Elf1